MKKKKENLFHALAWVAIVLAVAGCSGVEDIPPGNIDQQPEYYILSTLGNHPVEFEAGKDGIVHDTYHSTDVYSRVVYGARFYNPDCVNACESLVIEYTDIVQEENTIAGRLDGIGSGAFGYNFNNQVQTLVLNAMLDAGATNMGDLVWLLNGVTTFVSDSNAFEVVTGQPFSICLQNAGDHGCYYEQCISTTLSNQIPCHTDIHLSSSNDGILVEAIPHGVPPYTFAWSNGSHGSSIVLGGEPATSSGYHLTVTDATGCQNLITHSFDTLEGAIPQCVVNVNFSYMMGPGFNHDQESTFNFKYVDASGQVFRSDVIQQPEHAFFEILQVDELAHVPGGETGLKMRVRFSCQMMSEYGNIVEFQSEDAVLALSRLP